MLAAAQQKVCCHFNDLTRVLAAILRLKAKQGEIGRADKIVSRDEFSLRHATFICFRRI